jgi:hypothetical protein
MYILREDEPGELHLTYLTSVLHCLLGRSGSKPWISYPVKHSNNMDEATETPHELRETGAIINAR